MGMIQQITNRIFWLTVSGPLLFALALNFTACGSVSGISLAQLAEVAAPTAPASSITLDIADAGVTFNAALITQGTTTVSLTTLYQTIYDFSTLAHQGWNSPMPLSGGGFASGPTFASGDFSYVSDATNWHGMANLTSPLLTDYVMVSEFTANLASPLDMMAVCMRVQANLDQHYTFTMWSGNYNIYRHNAGFTGLATSAGFVPVVGTTYMIKSYAVGTALKLKIWAKGAAEPGAWGASATDATYASGYPCLDFYIQQNATYDNIRIGDATYTTDYSMSDPTFMFASATITGRTITSVTGSVTASGSDTVKFDVSIDGGLTFLAWNGSAWAANAAYAGAMTLSTLSTNISSLTVPATLHVRAHLHSDLGYSTPVLSNLVLNF
jgi:hypothetical protein